MIQMKKLALVIATCIAATPAFAHHPLAGQEMETFAHGLLSGFAHPVLGFDHLVFVILLGIAAVYTKYALITPLGFIAGMIAATVLVANIGSLPTTEPSIIMSLLLLGGCVASGRALKLRSALALFILAGIIHGAAFGTTIAEQEATISIAVITGYLIGLGFVQYAIALISGKIAEGIGNAANAKALNARLVGAFVFGIGVFLAFEYLENLTFNALNFG